ncbi:MAG: glycoside hydrolase family 9 protein [Verrucomicrobiota bacterium]
MALIFGFRANGFNAPGPTTLEMPAVGNNDLRIITPSLLELKLVTTKQPNPAGVAQWNFVTNSQLALPSVSEFSVLSDGKSISVASCGFKRRPLYAPLKQRDLRIGNYLYLQLSKPLTEGQLVTVTNPSGKLWTNSVNFRASFDPYRFSPAIHVNQQGYHPDSTKKAMIGFFLGSLGELNLGNNLLFSLVEEATTNVVFQGSCKTRADSGYTYSPLPYQKVWEADFSLFNTTGKYRLLVPDLGVSYPFAINEGVPAAFARAYALGIYHQRCGTDNSLPFTRHVHGPCHTARAEIPTPAFAAVNSTLARFNSDGRNASQTAPLLTNVTASRFPFQNTGTVDVSGGHHDAGDYSKYTINSAAFIHSLVFAADNFPGVVSLDNLGLPESGDGISDVLQEAKLEADFLAKMQDSDGGFYFLVYPRNRQYESDVLPDYGDPQVVFPKNTAATAAAVAALAQIASSPAFRNAFPYEAYDYLNKALRGWDFLENAFATFGRDGSYQKLTHYGDKFMHNDEMAWAATELFLATGDPRFKSDLMQHFDPSDPNTKVWGWWKMVEGYGCAIRSYAFAARSGRLDPSSVDTAFLAKCEAEIFSAANDEVKYANDNAYASSYPDPSKPYVTAGWYFSLDQVFDVAVAQQLNPKQEYLDCIVGNMNFEAGCNPLNQSFITGIGFKRQREIVHQYAQNDRRVLPPSGLPLGNLQTGFPWISVYGSELGELSFPPDSSYNAPHAPYDRWADTFNTSTEFVNVQQARSLAVAAFLMAQTSLQSQPWRADWADIYGLSGQPRQGESNTVSLTSDYLNLSEAQIVWEASDQEPALSPQFSFSPLTVGSQWVEAEATLVDGRRLFASTEFASTISLTTPPNSYRFVPFESTADITALYHFDWNFSSATTGGTPASATGNARLDEQNVAWMTNWAGTAVRVLDLSDQISSTVTNSYDPATQAIMVEAMIYVKSFKGANKKNATILSLYKNWDASLELVEDAYAGLFFRGGTTFEYRPPITTPLISKNQWHHLRIALDKIGYTIRIDGKLIGTFPSKDSTKWANYRPMTLTAGNFDGWLDEVAVRTMRTLQIGTPRKTSSGFNMQIFGNSGQQFVMEASTNLLTWSSLGTNTLSSTVLEVGDTLPTTRRYYRVRNLSSQFEY